MAFKAIASIIGASKQAKAAKNASEAQIQAAREAREFAAEEGERAYGRTGGMIRSNARVQNALANRSAMAQGRIARNAFDYARDSIDFGMDGVRNALNPFVGAGTDALSAYRYELGIGDQPDGYGGFEGTDGYRFRLQEGLDAVEGSAAARGGLYSGATLQALQQRGQGLAAQDYENHLARLAGLASSGQGASNALAGYNYGYGSDMANMNLNRGNVLSGIQANRFGALSGNRTDMTNALINRENRRSTIATNANTDAQSTIGNALANRAIGIGNAWQMGAQGVAGGIGNALSLGKYLGAF